MSPTTKADLAFWNFHRDNPDVYRALVRLARQAKSVGQRRLGMKMLFEVVRWERTLRTKGSDFKLNNNYTSRYARLIMRSEPDLNGMFDVRELRS